MHSVRGRCTVSKTCAQPLRSQTKCRVGKAGSDRSSEIDDLTGEWRARLWPGPIRVRAIHAAEKGT